MSYRRVLPQIFPWVAMVDRAHVPRIAELLSSTNEICANGTSFAVTSDSAPGTVNLWLSHLSLVRLQDDERWSRHFTNERVTACD